MAIQILNRCVCYPNIEISHEKRKYLAGHVDTHVDVSSRIFIRNLTSGIPVCSIFSLIIMVFFIHSTHTDIQRHPGTLERCLRGNKNHDDDSEGYKILLGRSGEWESFS